MALSTEVYADTVTVIIIAFAALVIIYSIATTRFKGPKLKNFQFLICDDESEVGSGKWYRLSRWRSGGHFLKMKSSWDRSWRLYADEEPVVGVTRGTREKDFLLIADKPDSNHRADRQLARRASME